MRIRYLAWLFPILFCCCNRTSSPVTPDPNFNFEYTAVYDSVIAMPANSTFIFIFNINVTNGDINNNRLGCTITGLPGNVTVIPASQVVGLIMGGIFTFTTGDIALGIDTLRFSINSPTTGTVIHKLILKIIPPTDYSPKLAGTYDSAFDLCSSDIYKHRTIVSTVTDTPYALNIANINNFGSTFVVRAVVSNVVRIPLQTVSGRQIWGSGTYQLDYRTGNTLFEMAIDDTVVSGIDTQRCTTHIQHL